jgi:hypothetical protein
MTVDMMETLIKKGNGSILIRCLIRGKNEEAKPTILKNVIQRQQSSNIIGDQIIGS